jgi:oxamate amidohydrolase
VTTPTRWRETRATRGIVATPHVLASRAGLAVLEQGGNALDAAIAAGAAISVVYPHMNGVGGDSFWLIYDGRNGRLRALNAAGRSAAAADLATYRARFGATIPVRGGAAALTVPGVVSGWGAVHALSRDTMRSPIPWRTLLEAAIVLARDGFAPSSSQQRETADATDLFGDAAPAVLRDRLWPVFHPERRERDRCVQAELASTLAEIAEAGADAFYRGPLAGRLARAAGAAGSPLTADDLAHHQPEWVEPLRAPYRGGEVASFPPPTQGFAALAILALLEGFDVRSLDEADYVHVVVEATKLAFEDRDRYLTDGTFAPVPVARCLDPSRLANRRRRISRRAAMPLAGPTATGGTIAVVSADHDGNAVCLIQSLYWEFGSGVIAGDTGVLLQNRGAFFSLDPGHVNCLAPRKQTAHTLIPSMYLVKGRPHLVYGTMGGEGQPQTQAALVTRIVDRGLDPQAAVEAPRWLFGRTWGEETRSLRLEDRFDDDVRESLRARGHDVEVVEGWSDLMGHAQLVRVDVDGFIGASDPRADGGALGV